MKIIISEKQVKILTEQQISYTDDSLSKYYELGKNYLSKLLPVKKEYMKQIMKASISDMLYNEKRYTFLLEQLTNKIEKLEDLIEKLYNVVDKYEITNRPDVVRNIEYEIINVMESNKYDMESLKDILESLFTSANDMRKLINQ